jgi:hypothetical protein
MGAGDWNDGMNRVGALGRGESVWLGWFAIAVIEGFCDLARRMQREDLVTRWGKRAEALAGVIDAARAVLVATPSGARKTGFLPAPGSRLEKTRAGWQGNPCGILQILLT